MGLYHISKLCEERGAPQFAITHSPARRRAAGSVSVPLRPPARRAARLGCDTPNLDAAVTGTGQPASHPMPSSSHRTRLTHCTAPRRALQRALARRGGAGLPRSSPRRKHGSRRISIDHGSVGALTATADSQPAHHGLPGLKPGRSGTAHPPRVLGCSPRPVCVQQRERAGWGAPSPWPEGPGGRPWPPNGWPWPWPGRRRRGRPVDLIESWTSHSHIAQVRHF